jgi:hypothetical protein
MYVCVGGGGGLRQVLGNPTGFVRSVASGLFDLFALPLHAITSQGPGGGPAPRRVLRGVVRGWTSLLSGLSQGALQSFAGECR